MADYAPWSIMCGLQFFPGTADSSPGRTGHEPAYSAGFASRCRPLRTGPVSAWTMCGRAWLQDLKNGRHIWLRHLLLHDPARELGASVRQSQRAGMCYCRDQKNFRFDLYKTTIGKYQAFSTTLLGKRCPCGATSEKGGGLIQHIFTPTHGYPPTPILSS